MVEHELKSTCSTLILRRHRVVVASFGVADAESPLLGIDMVRLGRLLIGGLLLALLARRRHGREEALQLGLIVFGRSGRGFRAYCVLGRRAKSLLAVPQDSLAAEGSRDCTAHSPDTSNAVCRSRCGHRAPTARCHSDDIGE